MRRSALVARVNRRALATIGVFAIALFAVAGFAAERGSIPDNGVTAELAIIDSTPRVAIDDSLFGFSGKLRMRFLAETTGEFVVPVLRRLLGDADLSAPGIYRVEDSERQFSFVTLLPFTEKRNGRIGTYRIGSWPGEHRRSPAGYENPQGFIVVTLENQDEPVSEHFRLRDFLTKDQRDVWP
ncbi:MAG TPA: hypothetical protein VMM18_17870, partial [Gemmatimonadaceae bacterium]|nr:hypothetical protein [Gemmatimonadaceae bacterium]